MKALLKKLYRHLPFKQQLFTLVKNIATPPASIYQHLHFQGIIRVRINRHVSFKMHHYGYQLENEVFWNGLYKGWEKESTGLWIKLCENANTILDIGANTGIFSLIAKSVNPKAKVYAFEPVERVYAKLQANCRLNEFDIHTEQKAISNKDGKAVIYDSLAEHIYSVTVNQNLASPETSVTKTEIQTITLNSFITAHALSGIDLIKIDVETHEPEVLEGFSEYLKKFQPTMLIEVLNEEVAEKLNLLLEGLPYLYFNIDERGGIRRTVRIGKSDYYNFLVCHETTARELQLI